ncbi:MAG: hypothetical protein M1821_002549 [Bathelium mastoideum]|nr:MAG: hypothetical protein M1821_002549 [Bathelium mastoideum]
MVLKIVLDGVALITGAGGGIGREAAFSLAEAGARVIIFADINEEAAKEAVELSKKHATHPQYQAINYTLDVTDPQSVQEMVDTIVKNFGRLDYAVNGAGVDNGTYASVADSVPEDYDNVMNVNSKGLMLCVRAEIKAMRSQEPRTHQSRSGTRDIGRGVIINVASANAFAGLPGKMAYTVSKHAVMGITKMAALDHAAEGIRVNAVCPTWVRTPLAEEECRRNPAVLGTVQAIVPNKRMAEPEEIADVIAFMCSPSASYVNGGSLLIDAAATLNVRVSDQA